VSDPPPAQRILLTQPFPQAIVDGDPPDLPKESYSDAARDFVHGCLNKIPKLRPTYPMLCRHKWLSPLLKPPTITEDDEDEAAAEAGKETGEQLPATADREVAEWVKAAIERKIGGKIAKAQMPALHAAPLDAVPGSPLLSKDGLGGGVAEVEVKADDPVPVETVGSKVDGVNSLDFAGGGEGQG